MAGYPASKGVPAARASVVASGVLMLAGGVMVLLGVWADLGALLILAFLVPTALLMHAFWKESEPGPRLMEQTQFMKNVSMAGGALALFGLFVIAGHHLGLTLTGPLIHGR